MDENKNWLEPTEVLLPSNPNTLSALPLAYTEFPELYPFATEACTSIFAYLTNAKITREHQVG